MNLVTLADVKLLLGIPTENTDKDALINYYIAAVSKAFETYCGFTFGEETVTEYHNGGTQRLFLKRTPINSITSIIVDPDMNFEDNNLEIDSDNYLLINAETGILIYKLGKWTDDFHNLAVIQVTYKGGYANVGAVPADLSKAAAEQTVYCVRRVKDLGLSSVSFPDGSIQKVSVEEFLDSVKAILDRYASLY